MRRRSLLVAGAAWPLVAACGPGERQAPGVSGARPDPATTPPPTPTSGRPSPPPSPTTPPVIELPRGGTRLFPRYRLVGYAGYPGADALGRLGIGALSDAVASLEKRAASYAVGAEPLPVLELIATIVQAAPGADGKYRVRAGDDVIMRHLRMARRHRALLLLNLQPGRARMIDEVKAYARWLREPDVGLALDPEWAMGPDEVPGQVFGHITGAELERISRYVAGIVADHHLPDKAIVYHQLSTDVVRTIERLHRHRGVSMIVSVDGIGTRAAKTDTWTQVIEATPSWVHPGFKIFFEEDRDHGKIMTTRQVLALEPRPDYVMYE